jgi:hypothetical protein
MATLDAICSKIEKDLAPMRGALTTLQWVMSVTLAIMIALFWKVYFA